MKRLFLITLVLFFSAGVQGDIIEVPHVVNAGMLIGSGAGGGAAAWHDDWGRKVVITVESTLCTSGSETAVPLLLTEATVPAEMLDTDLSYNCQSDGGDLRAYSGDYSASNPATENTNRLALEVVSVSLAATGYTLEAYVPVNVNCTTDQYITLYYNASLKSQPAIDAAYGAESVWDSSYVMVQHMNESTLNGTAGEVVDSTSQDNDGTSANTPTPGATGKIGNAINFVETSDEKINFGNSSADMQALGSTDFTVGMWLAIDAQQIGDQVLVWEKMPDAVTWIRMTIEMESGNDDPKFEIDDNSTKIDTGQHDGLVADAYSYLLIEVDYNTNVTMYINNSSVHAEGAGTGDASNTGNFNVGDWDFSAVDDQYAGEIDEIRIQKSIRTAAWREAEYNSMNAPGTYMTEGTPSAP